MASLSVTEKEHWKERIARRIDRKVEAISAADPALMDRICEQARQRALKSLGLAEMQAELEAVSAQRDELDRRERKAQRAMLAAVRRVPLEEVTDTIYGTPHEVTRAVEKRQAVHEDELLAEDPLGREVLRLRREKDELLDTVWLATSGRQIRELWRKVAELLGEEQSPLQQAALAIEPAEAG